MKIPDKYQVFRDPVEMTLADMDRLAPHLSNGNKLSNTLLLGISEEDLKRMVVIELMRNKRWLILKRLLPGIVRYERKRIDAKLAGLVRGVAPVEEAP